MQQIKLFTTILGLTSALSIGGMAYAAGHETTEQPIPQTQDALPDPVATVNGEVISKAMYEAYARQAQAQMQEAQMGDPNSPETRKVITDALVTQLLLLQEAEKQNLEADPEIASQLEIIRRNVLAKAVIHKLLTQNAPDDETINTEYEKLIAAQSEKKQYKARHILVDSEEKAKSVIEEVNEGADFSELAKTHSKDNSSSTGGDLGWFSPEVMVPDFAEAITALEKGTYTKEPVESRFGWHVIMLDDVRETAPPSLEQMRPQLTQQIQGRTINEYLAKLRKEAEVEIK